MLESATSHPSQAVDRVCWHPSSYNKCLLEDSKPAVPCHRHGENNYFCRFFLLVCIWSLLKSKHCNRIVTSLMHRTPCFTPLHITRRCKWHLQEPYDVGYIMDDVIIRRLCLQKNCSLAWLKTMGYTSAKSPINLVMITALCRDVTPSRFVYW
jgi:hypothetical protein